LDSLSIYKEKEKDGMKFVDSKIGLYETGMLRVLLDLGILMDYGLRCVQ
jgi:hypothetical protein